MRKILLSIATLAASIGAFAQGNAFNGSQVDADGWLWFDTPYKIQQYVGEGKLIQLVPAGWADEDGEYPEPYADVTVKGVGTDGILGGADCKTGAIVLPRSNTSTNNKGGGGILMNLPSCYELQVCFSCEATIRPSLLGGAGALETVDCGGIQSYIFTTPKTAAPGIYVWKHKDTALSTPLAEIENNVSFMLKSESPVTAWIAHSTTSPVYLHGIKVLVYGQGAGAESVNADDNSMQIVYSNNTLRTQERSVFRIYNMTGKLETVLNGTEVSVSGIAPGFYVVKATSGTATATQKIVVHN